MFASAKEKVTKVGSTATVVRNSVLIINYPILPFGIVACTFLLYIDIAKRKLTLETLRTYKGKVQKYYCI